ncbi:hypothetical protein, partial [Rhodovulum sulfidophilum]|uniref:hypothetical protein n=1 Tax=Rhodovulum sulfidophilum TaxID=35806 RepID=UPI001F2F44CA
NGATWLIHQPLQCPRHRCDHPRGLIPKAEGEVTPQAACLQQRPSACDIPNSGSMGLATTVKAPGVTRFTFK